MNIVGVVYCGSWYCILLVVYNVGVVRANKIVLVKIALNLKSSVPRSFASRLWISYGLLSRFLQVLISRGWHLCNTAQFIVALFIAAGIEKSLRKPIYTV